MKKYIELTDEVINRLVDGKSVEGRLRRDDFTGRITFKAYNRQPKPHPKDRLIKKLPWGWIKQSAERVKVFGSFPDNLGTAKVMSLLDEHTRDAKNALIERELIEFC